MKIRQGYAELRELVMDSEACVLRFMESQRVGDDWATELNWTDAEHDWGCGCYFRLDNQEGLFENDEKGPNMTRSGAESFSQRKRVGQDPDGKISLEERKKASEVGG